MPSDDREDLAAARGGDEEAARRLVARHGGPMVRTAWRVLGGRGGREADDVVQEALIAALTTDALPRGDVGAWLRAVTARKALDELRRARRRAEGPLPEDPEVELVLAGRDRPGPRLAAIAAREALATLSPVDRAVLVLTDLEGWSMAEAARMLGLTPVAVRLRASRARRRLARTLREGAAGGRLPREERP